MRFIDFMTSFYKKITQWWTNFFVQSLLSRFSVIAGFATIIILLLLTTLTGLSRIYTINENLHLIVHEQQKKIEIMNSLREIMMERFQLLQTMFLTEDMFEREELFQEFHLVAGEFIALRQQLMQMDLSVRELQTLALSRESVSAAYNARIEVADLLISGQDQSALKLMHKAVNPAYYAGMQGLEELLVLQKNAMHAAEKQAHQAYQEARWMMTLLGIVSSVIGIIISLLVFRRIQKREASLEEAKEAAEALADSHGLSLDVMNMQLEYQNKNLSKLNSELKNALKEMKKAKLIAESASEAKTDFLANMSHEIRTPLNAVIGMTSLMLDTQMDAVQRDYAETIHNSGEALLALINDILDFSKIEAGCIELEQTPFSLHECVEAALDLVAPKAAQKKLALLADFDMSLPVQVEGDVTRLRQVLVNLLGNAVKFTATGTISVKLRLQADGQDDRISVEFIVQDTGIGIPQNRIASLFEPFSQVDSSINRRYGGTGLGLSITKRLCGIMGGNLHVESEEGQGSQFIFTLSFLCKNRQEPEYIIAPPARAQGKRILVLDNHEGQRQSLAHMLRRWDTEVVCHSRADKALHALQAQPDGFDLLILEMEIPDTNGLIVCHEIRQHEALQQLPIILLVSIGSMAWQDEEVQHLFSKHLHKPVKFRYLHQALEELFAPPQVVQINPVPATETAEPERELRILLAEDNLVNQKVALLMLKKIGYRADIANNGVEVLQALDKQDYDVILMDMQMPEMDGMEATKRLRNEEKTAEYPHIIAMTAHAMEGYKEKCLAVGMNDYVTKPVRREALADALKLAHDRLSREIAKHP